jgi:hypothetical protein
VTAVALLRELSARGIRVVVQGDRVSLRGPGNVLKAELTDRLRQHKSEILEAVRHCPICIECGAAISPDEPETWWGASRVHLACGKAAWAREWKRETPPAEHRHPRNTDHTAVPVVGAAS